MKYREIMAITVVFNDGSVYYTACFSGMLISVLDYIYAHCDRYINTLSCLSTLDTPFDDDLFLISAPLQILPYEQ